MRRDTTLVPPHPLDSTLSHPAPGGSPSPFPLPLPPASLREGRAREPLFGEVFLLFFFNQKTLFQRSQTTVGHTRGPARCSCSAPIPCTGIIHNGPFLAFSRWTVMRRLCVPSCVLLCPCVPSVLQPHVLLHQRLCWAVPRRVLVRPSVCPRGVSVCPSSVPAVPEGPPSHSPLIRFAVPLMNRPPVI